MGYIPETVTRRLPSSVVGTLGVDTSGLQLGQSIAAAGNKVFGTMLAQQKEKKRTLDIIAAQAAIRQFESEMDGANTGIKGKFAKEPQGGVEQTFNAGEQLIEHTLAGIKDANVRAMVAQGTTASLRRSGNDMKNWASRQEVINGAENYTQITNVNATQLSKKPDVDLMEQFIDFELGRTEQAKMLAGKNWSEFQKSQMQSIYMGQIIGLEATDPKTGVRFLEEYDFKGVFSPEELKGLKKKMQDSYVGWKKDQFIKSEIAAMSHFDEIHKRDKDGTLDVAFIDETKRQLDGNGMLTPERELALDISRRTVARNTNVDAKDNEETLETLYDGLRNLGVSSDKKTAEASLKELFAFRLKVLQAADDGKIKDANKRFFLNQIITPSNSKALEGEMTKSEKDPSAQMTAFGIGIPFTGNVKTPEFTAYDKVESWLGTMNFGDQERMGAKIRILRESYIEMAKLREMGNKIDSDTAEVIVERKIRDEMASQRADLAHIPAQGKAYLDPNSGERFMLLPNGTKVPLE